MPTITTATTLCGAMPAPHTSAFLRWCDDYISRRKRQCVGKRATVYYIAANGNDSNNGTSPSTPWQTYAKVISHVGANPAGGYSFLFRRGDTFRSATGLNLSAPNVHFGSYGPLGNYTSDLPIISHFTVQWPAGSLWTLVSGTTYSASVPSIGVNNPSGAATVGFIRATIDPLVPLLAHNSQANCEATAFSFFVNAGTVYINLGGVDPNSLDFEAVPVSGSPPDGIRILNGSTGLWVDGLRGDGWGAGSQGLNATTSANTSWIVNLAGGTAAEAEHVCYISDCECYYHGAHALSQEPGGFGGTHIVENCIVGYGYNKINGLTFYNTYAGTARQECVFRNCNVRFGALPHNWGGVGGNVAFGEIGKTKAFFGHTNASPTNPLGLYLNIDCTILDERTPDNRATACGIDLAWPSTAAGGFLFQGMSATDPAAQRCFFINFRMPRCRTINSSTPVTGNPWFVFINSHLYIRKTWTGGAPNRLMSESNAIYINTIFDLECEGGDTVSLFEMLTLPAAGPRLINCLVIVRGHTSAPSTNRFHFTNSNSQDRLRIGNTVIICDRWRDGGAAVDGSGIEGWLARDTFGSSAKNDSNSLANVAIAGCATANSAPWLSFSAAAGLVNLATANNTYPDLGAFSGGSDPARRLFAGGYTLDPASPLVGAGAAIPFPTKTDTPPAPEYDFFGRRRPTIPSIGPFDLLNVSAGSGVPASGSSPSAGSDGFVRGVA